MTESIVSLLNTKLLATGYFKTLYGLADFKTSEGRTIPYMYCSKGNYKEVSNFDELNGSVYWRKTGEIRVTDGTSTAVKLNSRLLVMTIPLKMVATISRNRAGNDTGSTPENVAMSLFKSIASNLNGNIRQILQAKSIRLELNTINDDTRVIASEEFKGTGLTSLGDDLFMVSITLDAVMSIYEDCIPVDCDPTEACENLLLWLSAAQKNECILPAYDFTDPNVYNNLTDAQETALIDLLCEGSGVVNIKDQDDNIIATPACGTDYFVEVLTAIVDTIDSNTATIIDPIA